MYYLSTFNSLTPSLARVRVKNERHVLMIDDRCAHTPVNRPNRPSDASKSSPRRRSLTKRDRDAFPFLVFDRHPRTLRHGFQSISPRFRRLSRRRFVFRCRCPDCVRFPINYAAPAYKKRERNSKTEFTPIHWDCICYSPLKIV